jgi:sugar/nucleoside kinase (ribokinase family)
MNTRDTLEVHLNVLADFEPVLPESYRDSTHVFLANSSPATQASVLAQVGQARMVFADTMDLWIETQRPALLALLPSLQGLLLNDSEARALTGEENLVRAGHAVRRLGPPFVIVKKGEHGAMLFSDEGIFVMPAYPCDNVVDPTGAGDSFAGGMMGFLTDEGHSELTQALLRRAMAYGTVVASLIVEGFGQERLHHTDRHEIDARLAEYRRMLTF